jgi:hypothetical protein
MHLAIVDQHILTATVDTDDDGDRPTLPSLRAKQRPKVRLKAPEAERARFDADAERFFSNVVTEPELVVDAAFIARMTEATAPSEEDHDAAEWWAAQRRSLHLRLVAVVLAASLALLFAGALR